MRIEVTVLCVLLLAGCGNDLANCEWDGTAGISLNLPLGECRAEPWPCYGDGDGDGYGSADAMIILGPGEVCADAGGAPLSEGADCDEDDNNFPTNPEVCDGADNDCNGEVDFDQEGEEIAPSGDEPDQDDPSHFSCTPYDTVRFFLRGGGVINGQPVDGRSKELLIASGEPLVGTIKLRIFATDHLLGQFSGGVSVSAPDLENRGFKAIFDPRTSVGQIPYSPFDQDIELDGDYTLDEADLEFDNTVRVTLAAVYGQEPELRGFEAEGPEREGGISPDHVASLTSPWYCCNDCDNEPPCPAVWAPPPDDDSDFFDFVPDLVNLDALELASCSTHGAARFPFLVEAFDEEGYGCELTPGSPPDPDSYCYPLFDTVPVGCLSISLRVEE